MFSVQRWMKFLISSRWARSPKKPYRTSCGRSRRDSSVPDVVQRLSLRKITEAELAKMVSDVIQENWVLVEKRGKDAMQPLMGILMEKVRGRVDGKLVHELLERELQKFEFRTETS